MAAPTKTPKEATEMFTTDDVENNESLDLEDNPFDDTEVPSTDEADLAAILDSDIDSEELARKEAALSLPSGVYKWADDTCAFAVNFNEKDKKATDLAQKKGFNKGRMIFNVSGLVVNTETKRKGRLSFSMSPDERVTKDGEADFFSKNYALFTKYFFLAMERDPKKEIEVVAFIKSCKYSMYVTLSKTGSNFLNRVQKPE